MSLRLWFFASAVERIVTGCHVRWYVVLAVASSVRDGADNPVLHNTDICSGTQGYSKTFALGPGWCS